MIRHQVKIQDDPMFKCAGDGKTSGQAFFVVHSFSQSLALVDRANPRAVGCLINRHFRYISLGQRKCHFQKSASAKYVDYSRTEILF